jgi:hypothetical protein
MLLPRRRRGSKLSVEPSGNLTKLVRRCEYFVYLALLDALRGNHRRVQRQAADALHIIERRGWAPEPQALTTSFALSQVAIIVHR